MGAAPAYVWVQKARRKGSTDLTRITNSLFPLVKADLTRGLKTFKQDVDPLDLEYAARTGKWEAIMEALPWKRLPKDLAPAAARLGVAAGRASEVGRQALPPAADARLFHDPRNPRIDAYIKGRTGELITTTQDGAKAAARREVRRAQVQGLSPETVAANIRGSIGLNAPQATALSNYRAALAARGRAKEKDGPAAIPQARQEALADAYEERLLDYRAMMIARTELRFASNEGQMDTWREAYDQDLLGDDAGRQWQVDGNPCRQLCLPMNGIVVGLDEPWELPDGRLVQSPSESHPQCECEVILVFSRSAGR